MPDLKPDLSIFSKPQQMSIGDMLGAANQIGEIEGKRSLSEAIQQSTNPETKEVDFEKAMGIWGAAPGFKHPGDAIVLQQGAQQTMATRAQRQKGIAEIFARAAADPNVSVDDIRALVTSQFGPQSAPVVDKYLHGAKKNDIRQRLTSFGALYGVFPETVEVSTQTGKQIVPKVVQQQEINRGMGGPGGPGGDPNAVGGGVGVPGGMATYDEKARQPWDERLRAAGEYPGEANAYERAHQNVFKVGPTGAGHPNEEIVAAKKFLVNIGVMDEKKANEQITTYEEAKKSLEQLITLRGGPHGYRSDTDMVQQIAGQPNMSMQQATILDLLKANMALRRMQQVGTAEYAKMMQQDRTQMHVVPEKFQSWYAQWAPKQDIRAFATDAMTKAQRGKLNKDLKTPEDRAKFLASRRAAERSGVYNDSFDWHPGAE